VGLKESIEQDVTLTFLGQQDFAEAHHIDGIEIAVVLIEGAAPLNGGFELGVASSDATLYAAAHDIERKEPGQSLNIDGREYVINRWALTIGMHVVSLSQTIGV
jgi:hypothetical protein